VTAKIVADLEHGVRTWMQAGYEARVSHGRDLFVYPVDIDVELR
jgi:antirestriction protein ArdC